MKKVLFIDRDGTIVAEPEDEQVDSFEKLKFLPGAIGALSGIARELDFELVMVTNQDGLGTGSYPEETFWPVQNLILDILKGEGVIFSEIFIDRTFPYENAATRKPGTALLTKYLATGIDMKSSYVIGDRLTDARLAENLGCKSITIGKFKVESSVLCTGNWNDIYSFLKCQPRIASIKRETSETSVEIELNLDGTGKSAVSTGIGFFDHMLKQIPNHGKIDLSVQVRGDLDVDEHHTIEDVALALGSAFLEALGKKKGIERYGFTVPMDDSIARVAVDFGGRPGLVWKVKLSREKIGEMPSEMFSHFFRSFTDNAKCTLSVEADGSNEHHIVESVFKAFSRAIGAAVRQTGSYSVPSSKGVL
ncbi:MAG TPA: bifunctional histidinol-phosphatase/imidazoleglycerol-phosphate dehydratase HisB [Bacteroidales bacterium]|nr:bifunctional histidinol-phosphatase/imidazoleglycerol-phosphate dehydratase HisB [Bacteroidales bacterium]